MQILTNERPHRNHLTHEISQDIDLQNIVTPASQEMRKTILCCKEIRYFTESEAAPRSQKFINPRLCFSAIHHIPVSSTRVSEPELEEEL